MSKKYTIWIAFAAGLFALMTILICRKSTGAGKGGDVGATLEHPIVSVDTVPWSEPPLAIIQVIEPIPIGRFFKFMDILVKQYDTIAPYELSEYLIVRANPWIIDTLENTDYYRQMERGNFVFEQQKMIVLKAGDTLRLPGPQTAAAMLAKMKNTWLDINIPAFRLRIMEGDSVLYRFPVRVGKNQKKFLALVKNNVDLRTHTGTGEIIRISRNPVFYDPVTGKQFKFTKRDDHKTTLMPLIPWIEPSIDGMRYGQMIHPTTNPRSLGKAASNGCIGLKEADAWRVYYYAPLGTGVRIRYDLMEIGEQGDTLRYDDVYRYKTGGRKYGTSQASLFPPLHPGNVCWCKP